MLFDSLFFLIHFGLAPSAKIKWNGVPFSRRQVNGSTPFARKSFVI